MTLLTLISFLPALLGISADASAERRVVGRMVVRDEIILRIPVRPRISPAIEWVEKKGPKCIDADRIKGAALSGASSIDFVLQNRRLVRAELDSACPALDFYRGFYLQPDDDRICAKRETVRSRVGGSCRIERFRTLVPQLKR